MLNQQALENAQLGDVFAYGKLDPVHHAKLVNELPRFAREAGITVRDISGADYALTDFEKDYLVGFNRLSATGKVGLLYIGSHDPHVYARMKSAVGALLRNYIDARFMMREILIHELFDRKRRPDATLMAVPDLTVDNLSDGPKRALKAWVADRVMQNKQTLIGVPSHKALDDLFGKDADILKHFKVLTGVIQN